MKYFHVYYDGTQYKLSGSDLINDFNLPNQIATFYNFDMAYQYLITLNGMGMTNNYSRWMQR